MLNIKNRTGAVMIVIIAGIVLAAVLGAGLAAITPSSVVSSVQATFALDAVSLASSGLDLYKVNGPLISTYTLLGSKVINVSDILTGTVAIITSTVEPNTILMATAQRDWAVPVGSGGGAPEDDPFITFGENRKGFQKEKAFHKPGGSNLADPKRPPNANLDPDNPSLNIEFDSGLDSYGALWYYGAGQETDQYCDDQGRCPFNGGINAFFKFSLTQESKLPWEGFTFTVLGAGQDNGAYRYDENDIISGYKGQNLGYGSNNIDLANPGESNLYGVKAPKVAVEFDFIGGWSASAGIGDPSGSGLDTHMAIDYWGAYNKHRAYYNTAYTNAYEDEILYDDVIHGYGPNESYANEVTDSDASLLTSEVYSGGADLIPSDIEACTCDQSDGCAYTNTSGVTCNVDTVDNGLANPGAATASDFADGFEMVDHQGQSWNQNQSVRVEYRWDKETNIMTTTAWLNCTNCDTVRKASPSDPNYNGYDFTGSCTAAGNCYKVTDVAAIPPDLAKWLKEVRFGWTVASDKDVNSKLTILNLKLYFLDYP